jgi:uracil-DNA glycosylase
MLISPSTTSGGALPAKDVRLEATWKQALAHEFQQPYFHQLTDFVAHEYRSGTCYPPARLVFHALDSTPLPSVRVVILGQDPYHGPGQAHGLCFSVPPGVPLPPSLGNIYKELETDLGGPAPQHGNLEGWAQQGVLLLNTCLTVRAGQAASHAGKGWEQFTDAVIRAVNEHRQGVVFLLWGSHAGAKKALVNTQRHHILQAPHPSPLSAHRGFLGCRHFSKTNSLLRESAQPEIDWLRP